jgi:proline iminopeptidase
MYSMAPDFVTLAATRKLVFYDQRGGGRSEPVIDAARLGWRHHVADLEALRQHLGPQRIDLLGVSWGSALAVLYAQAHPDHVNRMVLFPMRARAQPEIPAGVTPPASVLTDEEQARLRELRAKWEQAENPVAICQEYWAINARAMFHDARLASSRKGRFCDEPPDVLRSTWRVSDAKMASLGDFDFRPMLSDVRVPTLVIKGTESGMVRSWVEEWARALPTSRMLWIPEAGLEVWVEKSKIVLAAIDRFLNGQWPQAARVIRNDR